MGTPLIAFSLSLGVLLVAGCGTSASSNNDGAMMRDLSAAIDGAGVDLGAALQGTSCFVVDPPRPDCVCAPWYRGAVGTPCAPVGQSCTVHQDQSFLPRYSFEIRCGANGKTECVSGPCECIVDPRLCERDMSVGRDL